jgi:nucleoside-diphosphate-sugar epimerase
MAKVVAVTGATGFVGSHLVHRLAREGWSVRILARRMPDAALVPDATIDVVIGDLGDARELRRLVRGADAVIHVAGIVKARRPEDFQTANVEGTHHVLAALSDAAPTARFIHISSLAAREPHLSPYAASKRAAEDLAAAVSERQPVTIIRPPAVYGPGDLEILPMFRAAAGGICPYPRVFGMRLSMIHVADLAAAIAGVAAIGPLPELRYEVDDGKPGGYSWDEIAGALSQAFGRKVKPVPVPRMGVTAVAAFEQLRQSLGGEIRALSLTKVPELVHPDWVARGASLWDQIALKPGINLVRGFQETLGWYSKSGYIRAEAFSADHRRNSS